MSFSFQILPPKRLVVMQGVPGSGKSTMARTIKAQFLADRPIGVVDSWDAEIFSTDDYWMDNGIYRFNPGRLGDAHRQTQRNVIYAMQAETCLIIVDNTNVQKWQAEPYFALANMFGYEIQVVSVAVPLEEALARNKRRSFDRRIPEEVIRQKYVDMEQLL